MGHLQQVQVRPDVPGGLLGRCRPVDLFRLWRPWLLLVPLDLAGPPLLDVLSVQDFLANP